MLDRVSARMLALRAAELLLLEPTVSLNDRHYEGQCPHYECH